MSARRLRRNYPPKVPSHWHCPLLPPLGQKIQVVWSICKGDEKNEGFRWITSKMIRCFTGNDLLIDGRMDDWMDPHLLYLVNDPWAEKVSIFRRLPPAEASGGCAGAQRDLQGNQASLIAVVAEEEFLQEAPGKTPVHRELQQDWLRARVRSRLTTAKAQEELNKPAGYSH